MQLLPLLIAFSELTVTSSALFLRNASDSSALAYPGRTLPPITLHARGSQDVNTPCGDDSDCLSGWCAFPSEVGKSGYAESRICRLMPATGTVPAATTPNVRRVSACPTVVGVRVRTPSARATSTVNSGICVHRLGSRSATANLRNIGQTCSSDSDCGSNAKCNTAFGVCDAFPHGAACNSHAQCLSYMCGTSPRGDDTNQKVCLPVPAGSSCTKSRACASGLCDGQSSPVSAIARGRPLLLGQGLPLWKLRHHVLDVQACCHYDDDDHHPKHNRDLYNDHHHVQHKHVKPVLIATTTPRTTSTSTSTPTSTRQATTTSKASTSSTTTAKPLPSGVPCGTNPTCQSGYLPRQAQPGREQGDAGVLAIRRRAVGRRAIRMRGCLSGTCK
ncbi:hypothetical protein V8E36_005137 [Tilletia maclaganii]